MPSRSKVVEVGSDSGSPHGALYRTSSSPVNEDERFFVASWAMHYSPTQDTSKRVTELYASKLREEGAAETRLLSSGTAIIANLEYPQSIIWLDTGDDASALFSQLVKQWHEERGITSSLPEMFMCPSYQQVIEMGERAVPLILAQLVREGDDPDHWYAALEAITGEDPVPEDAYGDTVQIAKAWLSWAEVENVWYSMESKPPEALAEAEFSE